MARWPTTATPASDTRAVLATVRLSILAGHHRDAPSKAIRHDGINPQLLCVAGFVPEEAARRALARMDESSGVVWLDRHLATMPTPLLTTPGILDLDATGTCRYGKQDGAGVGSNPKTPWRSSHSEHRAWMASTPLALAVDVLPGNETAPTAPDTGDLGLAGCFVEGDAPDASPWRHGRESVLRRLRPALSRISPSCG